MHVVVSFGAAFFLRVCGEDFLCLLIDVDVVRGRCRGVAVASVKKKTFLERRRVRGREVGSEVSAWGMIKSIFRARDDFFISSDGEKKARQL